LLNQCSKPIEEFPTRIKKMHTEAQTIVVPIKQSTNFFEIQVDNDSLDSMDEVNRAMKTTL
jgi:uncharacterized protein YaaN involved in tellurite resistance